MKKQLFVLLWLCLLPMLLVPFAAAQEAVVPPELVGSWTGVSRDGIQLAFTVDADGTGRYTFTQQGYTESYDFTLESDTETFSATVPADNQLGISACGGTYAYGDGVLTLDITTAFAGGRDFQYVVRCERESEPRSGPKNGTYLYDQNEKYSITIKDNACRLGFGSNFITAGCQEEGDGTLRVTGAGPYHQVDLTLAPQEGGLWVSGDLILKNARGQINAASLLGLDHAVFTPKPPFALSQIPGSSWIMSTAQSKNEGENPFTSFMELSFYDGGEGVMGDWFSGTYAFTHTVGGNAVTLTFAEQDTVALGTLENDELILDLGAVVVRYTTR